MKFEPGYFNKNLFTQEFTIFGRLICFRVAEDPSLPFWKRRWSATYDNDTVCEAITVGVSTYYKIWDKNLFKSTILYFGPILIQIWAPNLVVHNKQNAMEVAN